ncbi:hypothetical protein J4H86_11030 [Spiractinospora alimapuensis]|uniref:glycine-rich domain-containing protein n=1 Tax=Spiractinospora alimapuensis TaxID=2820884 RepID=UPI001F2CA5F9|nr:hypothetical protein [Spiractinospora alimapuensis]QVQ54174.1 hypothetical protein J4H86_11030 [Spiractinospora alimapuensis]
MTIIESRPVGIVRRNPRDLITEELYDRLVRRIVKEENVAPEYAGRVMDQALAFLAACGENPGLGLSPSRSVDVGWHTFILYTRHYAEFCARVAGRFIHHEPTDYPGAEGGTTLRDTVSTIERAGYPVDVPLWNHSGVMDCEFEQSGNEDCSQCHKGCTDSNSK